MERITPKLLSKQASKQVDISILRIVATIAVLFLHTNSTLTDNRELFQLTDSQYIFHLCVCQMLHWAVPVFLMITGALLLKRERTITFGVCTGKYCKRVLLALFIFGVPFSMMELFMNGRKISFAMFAQAVMNVIAGKSFAHLWYLYVLIGIYLVLPFLKSATDNMDKKEMKIFLIILFAINFCLPMAEKLTDTTIAFVVPFTTFPVFYVVCGHYIEEFLDVDRKMAAIGFVCMEAISVIIALLSGSGEYLGYDSPVIGIAAIFLFLLFKGIQGNGANERLWRVDRLCFGVYLIHPVFIHFAYRLLKITPVSFDMYWLVMPVFGVVFTVISFLGSWVMSKIKPLRKYVL